MTFKTLSLAAVVTAGSLVTGSSAQAQDFRLLNPTTWFGGSAANCNTGNCPTPYPQTRAYAPANVGYPAANCVNGYCPPNYNAGYGAPRPVAPSYVPAGQYNYAPVNTYPAPYNPAPAYRPQPYNVPYQGGSNYIPTSNYNNDNNTNSPFYR